MRFPVLLPLGLLLACAPDVGVIKHDVDNDNDGYNVEVDCNDGRADLNPEADEVCDGEDNDCDGDVDGGAIDAPTWFADADGDGHGDPARVEAACTAPAGFVATADDCDDQAAAAFPGNPEFCDGIDNDCDGAVDDDAADATPWYGDHDGDGYGDPTDAVSACEPPAGYVGPDTDCDDADATVHPDAPEPDCADPVDHNCDGSVRYADADADGVPACEDCDDTDATRSPLLPERCDAADVDEDCDGAADDADASAEPGGMTPWFVDADGDRYGDATDAGLSQCDAPGGYVDTATDCDDADGAVNPGATEVCDPANTDEDCDGLVDDGDPSVSAASKATWYRDADTDTYGDAGSPVAQCAAPAGHVADATDCDDADGAVNPGATEVCDAANTDEDCDTLADDADPDATGRSDWYADTDGDGYGDAAAVTPACDEPAVAVADATDCDDADGAVNPGATEVCDAADTDEDCDGLADDADPDVSAASRPTWYLDADGDGFGGPSSTSSCEQPAATTTSTTDCDDGDADTFPGAAAADSSTACMNDDDGDGYGDPSVTAGVVAGTDCDDTRSAVSPAGAETCATSYDDDCDGSTNDLGAVACTAFHYDGDSDGYGLLGTTECRCVAAGAYAVAGVTSADDDCDDGDAAVSPGAAEVCDAADTDEDCDGLADDADPGATGKSAAYADADLDGYGSMTASADSCDAPAGTLSTGTDCDDATDTTYPGAPEVCSNSTDDDCDGDTDEGCPTMAYGGDYAAEYAAGSSSDADAVVYGEAPSDYFGTWVVAGVDLDGDGQGNFVVSASGNNYLASYNGSYYVYDGFPTGIADADTDDVARVFGGGTTTYTIPESLWGLEDFDGDGRDELAAVYNFGGTRYVYIHDGEDLYTTASFGTLAYYYDYVTLTGPAASLGDENSTSGDNEVGVADWDATSNQGEVNVYAHGTSRLSTLATIQGEDAGDYAGFGLAGGDGNDPNGDGYDDVFIGAYGDDTSGADAGAAYVVEAPVASSFDLSAAQVKITGGSAGDSFGYVVGAPGDVDGDGREDLLVTAPYDDDGGADAGVVFLFEDVNTDGATKDNDSTDAEVKIIGENASDTLGYRAPAVGDVNGDGELDIFLGAAGWDNGTATGAGAGWLLYGPLSGTYDLGSAIDYDARFLGNSSNDACGASVALGDLDADGADDLLLGCTYGDPGALTGYGTVYVFSGG